MTVLYISCKRYWGGVTSWMLRTASGLQKKGHRIILLVHPRSRIIPDQYPELEIIPYSIGPDFNPLAIWRIRKIIKRNRVDLVVANIEKEIIVGSVAARITGIPLVRRVGREDDFKDRLKYRLIQKHMVDHNIVPSKAVFEEGRRTLTWLNINNFTVIHNGRESISVSQTEKEAIKQKYNIPQFTKILGVTCMLGRIKNVTGIIRAFSLLQSQLPDWDLVIAGEGPEQEMLESLAKEVNLSHRIHFVGFVTDPIVFSSIFDIAILNSWNEGFPNIIVEYLATGRPVIATNVGGTSDIIVNGRTGILVEPGNTEQLIVSILDLAKDRDKALSLGASGKDFLNKQYSEQKMIDKLESCYSAIISDRNQKISDVDH